MTHGDSQSTTPHQLTSEYYSARRLVSISAALLLMVTFDLVESATLPLIGVKLPLAELGYPLVCVVAYSSVRSFIEWLQSDPRRRQGRAARFDLVMTYLLGAASVGLFIRKELALENVTDGLPFAWTLGLIAFGIAAGEWCGFLLFSLSTIRSRAEAARIGLPRTTVLLRSFLLTSVPVLLGASLFLIWVYLRSFTFTEPLRTLWSWLIVSPAALIVAYLAWLYFLRKQPAPDGCPATLTQRLRPITNQLDARYQDLGLVPILLPPEGLHDTRLYEAALKGDQPRVRELLQSGLNPDEQFVRGWNPLLIAVAEGHKPAVSTLLGAGADPNVVNTIGRTPLMFAARYGFVDIARELIAHGADVNRTEDLAGGSSALHSAAWFGHSSVVQLLIERGADTKAKDRNGDTPLDLAQKAGHGESAELLRRVSRRPTNSQPHQ